MTEEIHSAYQTLELPIGADLPQVQKAWREMVQVWHPDRFRDGSDLQRKAEERTKQINNARDILKRYLIDGDIPRSRPRPSKQSRKQESQKQTSRPRPRPSTQSRKQESQQQTRRQETTSEDAHSSQTHEEEDLAVKIGAKIGILAAKIGGVIRIIFAIIYGAIIGHFIPGVLVSLLHVLDWMIEAVSGWSFIDSANPWIETFPSKTLIIVPIIVTFLGRIISAMLAEDQRKFIGSAEDWFLCTFAVVLAGTFGGIFGSGMGSIGIFIGAVLGACLGHLIYLAENDD